MTAPAVVVTLHGFLGAPSLWSPVFAAAALAGLPSRLEHAWLPGHGPEPWWLPGATFAQVIDAFAPTLPAGAWLVGYSLGARVALGLLAQHPERFAGASLIGAHPGLEDPPERAERVAWDEAQAREIEARGLPAFVERWQGLPIFATQATLPESTLQAQRAARLAHQPQAVAWAMRALGLGAMPAYGRDFTGDRPLRLITGSLDPKFTTLAARALTRWTGATHHILAGVGHNAPLEAPDALAETLREGFYRAG